MARLGTVAGVSALVAVGCRERLALPDVPISGGTERQRAAAREELRAFDGWIGRDRLEIAALEFKPLGGELFGKFYRAWDRIDLEESLEVERVRGALRHELCHALDDAEGLMSAEEPSFQDFGDRLYDREQGIIDDSENGRGRRSEALAILCESGPLAAASLTEPCSGDPDLAGEMFDFVAREVWAGYDPSLPPPLGEPVASAGPFDPWDSFRVVPTESSERINLLTRDVDREAMRQLEVATGAQADVPWVDSVDIAEETSTDPTMTGRVVARAGWASGPAVAMIEFSVLELGDFGPRLVWFNEEKTWTPVPSGCVMRDMWRRDLFTAADRVWYASGDGLSVGWSPIGE